MITDRKFRYAIDLPAEPARQPEHLPTECGEIPLLVGRMFNCPICARQYLREDMPSSEGLVCYGDGTIESREG
jgi:hypothetical protein